MYKIADFILTHLPKINTITPNVSNKYFLSHCAGKITSKTPTTEGWLKVIKSIKLNVTDYDKSRVLLGYLESYGSVIIKIGDSEDILNEYNISKVLHKIKGFVKYICFFECADDFRNIPSNTREYICKGVGSSILPHFPLGSLAQYNWNQDNIHIFKSCIKQSILSYLSAFYKERIIHNDFHAANILLKTTKSSYIDYDIPEIGTISLPTYGMRIWIIDFEKSSYADFSTTYNMINFNNFYNDINDKLIRNLRNFIRILDVPSIIPINTYLDKLYMKTSLIKKAELEQLFKLIDAITFNGTG